MTTAKDYRNDIRPNWCPGCGHYGVQAAITDAVVAKNIPPEKLAVISGIGCSSRIGGYFYAYGAHTTHGRALPYAQGVKLANQDLEVIACSGDGDAFAIGMGHTIHAPVSKETLLGYYPCVMATLTQIGDPYRRQCLTGSLTGVLTLVKMHWQSNLKIPLT